MEDKLKGELMDLQHGLTFLNHVKVDAGTGKKKNGRQKREELNLISRLGFLPSTI